MKYFAVFIPVIEGGYTVVFPDFPEIVTEGESLDNAIDMAQEILDDTIIDYKNEKRNYPAPSSLAEVQKIAQKEREGRGVDLVRSVYIQEFSTLLPFKMNHVA